MEDNTGRVLKLYNAFFSVTCLTGNDNSKIKTFFEQHNAGIWKILPILLDIINNKLRFFSYNIPELFIIWPRKFPSLPLPGKTPDSQKIFVFLPKQALVRFVSPRVSVQVCWFFSVRNGRKASLRCSRWQWCLLNTLEVFRCYRKIGVCVASVEGLKHFQWSL